MQSYDVVIIGGGVIGSAIAYFLSADAGFRGKVAVVERDPGYMASSSSLSASAIRQQFGTRPNIRMSAFGITFLREAKERLRVEDEAADIGLREPGYLVLGSPDHLGTFEARHEVQRAEGVAVEMIYRPALGARFPWLNSDDLAVGSLGTSDEGWFDGPALHQAFRRKARTQKVSYLHGEVAALATSAAGRIEAVQLASGERIGCGTVVNAAGAWSGHVARMAGIALPVMPRKRCVFVFDSPEKIAGAPFVLDPSGVWLRPEGHLYICGVTPETENEPDDFSLDVDHELFDDVIWPALAHRIPGFERLRLLRAWAGHYDYNVFDHSAILGRHPEHPNFVLAAGFSGHGMMHAPAAGLSIAELIAHGASRTLDITPFAFERIAANRPLVEHVY